jgi:hypothetical protein
LSYSLEQIIPQYDLPNAIPWRQFLEDAWKLPLWQHAFVELLGQEK